MFRSSLKIFRPLYKSCMRKNHQILQNTYKNYNTQSDDIESFYTIGCMLSFFGLTFSDAKKDLDIHKTYSTGEFYVRSTYNAVANLLISTFWPIHFINLLLFKFFDYNKLDAYHKPITHHDDDV